ncbi:biliverdin-producing heme oxygenase [Flavisolibacter sp. BT320]|nr:biliverdin-producing heme oxygenase [Flavisolibacter longurius]
MPLAINDLPLAGLVKNATQSVHEEVEGLLLPALASIRTTEDYASILKMFYGYFYPLEKQIENHIQAGNLPDIKERRKAASILHDLRQIGQPTENLFLCDTLPAINNAPQAFGALYVLEGSTLGGKQIAKMLTKNPAIPEGATRFFSGYGDQTGSRWKAFLEVFNQQPQKEEVTAAATETFYFLKGWMQHAI